MTTPVENETLLFQRAYRLTVISAQDNSQAVLQEHHMEASIEFTSSSKSSTKDHHKIKIYNASPDIVQQFRKEKVSVQLQAGYLFDGVVRTYDELPLIYVGEVVRTEVKRKGDDIVTLLHCSFLSAILTQDPPRFSAKFGVNTPRSSILERIASSYRSVVTNLSVVVDLGDKDRDIQREMSFGGMPGTLLDDWCNNWGAIWYQENKTIYIVDKDKKSLISDSIAFNVEQERVIGTVNFVKDITQSTSTTKHDLVQFEVFLEGRIKLGDIVNIKTTENGVESLGSYTVDSISHKLSLYGTAWHTSVEASKDNATGTT